MATLRTAVQRLGTLGRITGVSSLYQTEPVGYQEQPAFLNAVVALETELAPVDLLQALLGVERELGRTRSFPNAPRTLDLLPHPRLHERSFGLVPLVELAPEVVHPEFGQTVREILRALPDRSGVEVYAPAGWESAPSGVG